MTISFLIKVLSHHDVEIVNNGVVLFSGFSDEIPIKFMNNWVDNIYTRGKYIIIQIS